MLIYCAHSSGFDYAGEFYRPIELSQAFRKHRFVFPHASSPAPQNSRKLIESCDLMLAEVSFPSTGMGIEMGWASDLGKQIWAIHRHDKVASSSVRIIADIVIAYHSLNDVLERLS